MAVWYLKTLRFSAVLLAGGMHVLNPATARNINYFQIIPGGVGQPTQAEWRRLPQPEISCLNGTLRQQGGSVDDLINRGVMPSDPRLSQLRSNCRRQIAQRPKPAQPPRIITAQLPRFIAEGLAIGGRVRFEDKTNRQDQCIPSEFSGFSWCHEVRKQIDRLSAKFGEHAREFRLPQRQEFPNSIIANPVKFPTEGQAATSENAGADGHTTDQLIHQPNQADAVRPGAERLQRNDAGQAADQENLEDNPTPANGFSEPHISTSEPIPVLPPIMARVTLSATSDNQEKSPTDVTSENAPAPRALAISRVHNIDPVRPAGDETMPQSNNTDAAAARSEDLEEPRSQNLGLIAILTTIVLLGLAVSDLFVRRHNKCVPKTRLYNGRYLGIARESFIVRDMGNTASNAIPRHSRKIAPAETRSEKTAQLLLPMEPVSFGKTKQSADETIRPRLALARKRAIGSGNRNPLRTTAPDSLSKCRLPYRNDVATDSYFGEAPETSSEKIASENATVEEGATVAKLFAAGNPSSEELNALKLLILQAFGVYQEGDAAGPQAAAASQRL
jgi:hypothetical protein